MDSIWILFTHLGHQKINLNKGINNLALCVMMFINFGRFNPNIL